MKETVSGFFSEHSVLYWSIV